MVTINMNMKSVYRLINIHQIDLRLCIEYSIYKKIDWLSDCHHR